MENLLPIQSVLYCGYLLIHSEKNFGERLVIQYSFLTFFCLLLSRYPKIAQNFFFVLVQPCLLSRFSAILEYFITHKLFIIQLFYFCSISSSTFMILSLRIFQVLSFCYHLFFYGCRK